MLKQILKPYAKGKILRLNEVDLAFRTAETINEPNKNAFELAEKMGWDAGRFWANIERLFAFWLAEFEREKKSEFGRQAGELLKDEFSEASHFVGLNDFENDREKQATAFFVAVLVIKCLIEKLDKDRKNDNQPAPTEKRKKWPLAKQICFLQKVGFFELKEVQPMGFFVMERAELLAEFLGSNPDDVRKMIVGMTTPSKDYYPAKFSESVESDLQKFRPKK